MVLTYKECEKPRVILFHMVVFQMVLGSNGTSWKILLWNGASKGTDRYSQLEHWKTLSPSTH